MPVVQFTRFRVPEEHQDSVLAVRQASVESCRIAHPELQGAFLVVLEGGDLLDIAVWSDGPHPRPHPGLPPSRARAEFFALIEELLGEEIGILVDPPLRRGKPVLGQHVEKES